MDISKTIVQEESLKIISSYFGEKTAKSYENKFIGKTDAMVLIMVREILGDYLGQEKTEMHMRDLYKLIDDHENK